MNKEKFNMEDYVNGLFQTIISANQAGKELMKKQKEKKNEDKSRKNPESKDFQGNVSLDN